jgi:prohibitin 2
MPTTTPFDFQRPPSISPTLAIGGLIAILIILLAIGSFHIVPPGHRGISVTLGRVDPIQRGEGLAFKVPLIQKIINFPIMQLKDDGQAATFSSDLQNMTVSFTVMYRVPEGKVATLFQQYRGDPYQTLIEPRVQESIKQVASSYRAEDIVKNRETMKVQVLERVQAAVGDLLNVVDIPITNLDISDQLQQAIEQKVVREQEALAKQFELEKEKRQAEITLVRAEAEAKSVRVRGEAIKAAPEVIQLEIAQKWDGKAPLSVSVGQSGANILLPLR